ncbi:hypothetical protein IPZ68_04515 [Streptomyces arenae]|nr:hypothetical protein [Streptomyces arenae]
MVTSPIDHLLARARLIDAVPTARAGDERPTPYAALPRAHAPARRRGRDNRAGDAAWDLRTLCETVVTGAAVDALSRGFLTQTVPAEPAAARVLGCILHLGDVQDGARFWWQFAAGAGDHPSSYCLALQHRSLGEEAAAAWWFEQIPGATEPDEQVRAVPGRLPPIRRPASLPTTLRILSRLRPDRRPRARQPVIGAVMDYVVSTVKFVDDDLELPLPGPEFIARIRALTSSGTLRPSVSPPPPDPDPDPLPTRHRDGSAISSAHRRVVLDLRFCVPS